MSSCTTHAKFWAKAPLLQPTTKNDRLLVQTVCRQRVRELGLARRRGRDRVASVRRVQDSTYFTLVH